MFARYSVKFNGFPIFSQKFSSLIKSSIKKTFNHGITKTIYLPITMVGSFLLYSLSRNYNTHSSGQTVMFRLDGYINMQDGEMKSFKYGTKDHETILIVKYNGQFHALSNSCPHFGAPLHTGTFIYNIRCYD